MNPDRRRDASPVFQRCLTCGADRAIDVPNCTGCGESACALVVVGWSVKQARRADRITEWRRSINALSWATKAGLLGITLFAIAFASTMWQPIVCAGLFLTIVAFVLFLNACVHARRPPFEEHHRGDHSWMFAGPWLFALTDRMTAAAADEYEDEAVLDELEPDHFDSRIPTAAITSLRRTSGATPGLQRIELRIDHAGTTDHCRLEMAVDESTAAGCLEIIRTWITEHAAAPGVSQCWRPLAVDPRSENRLARVGSNALVLRLTPFEYRVRSIRSSDSALIVLALTVMYALAWSILPLLVTGVLRGGPDLMFLTGGTVFALFLLFGMYCALRARRRWSRGGARFCIIADRCAWIAEDLPERPFARGPAEVSGTLSLTMRPDLRAPRDIRFRPRNDAPVELPGTLEPMDLPTLWSLADEITGGSRNSPRSGSVISINKYRSSFTQRSILQRVPSSLRGLRKQAVRGFLSQTSKRRRADAKRTLVRSTGLDASTTHLRLRAPSVSSVSSVVNSTLSAERAPLLHRHRLGPFGDGECLHSTVTDLAKFRGLSTSFPRITAA